MCLENQILKFISKEKNIKGVLDVSAIDPDIFQSQDRRDNRLFQWFLSPLSGLCWHVQCFVQPAVKNLKTARSHRWNFTRELLASLLKNDLNAVFLLNVLQRVSDLNTVQKFVSLARQTWCQEANNPEFFRLRWLSFSLFLFPGVLTMVI